MSCYVKLCNVMLCHVMTGSHVIFSCHLVKLGVLFPDITLTNCWKVRAEVELENLESDIYRVSTGYLQGNRTLDGWMETLRHWIIIRCHNTQKLLPFIRNCNLYFVIELTLQLPRVGSPPPHPNLLVRQLHQTLHLLRGNLAPGIIRYWKHIQLLKNIKTWKNIYHSH